MAIYKIRTNSGRTFTGPPKRIVYHMMKQDYICHAKTSYMDEVKERLKVVYDEGIEFTDHMSFLRELERVGLLTIEEVDWEKESQDWPL